MKTRIFLIICVVFNSLALFAVNTDDALAGAMINKNKDERDGSGRPLPFISTAFPYETSEERKMFSTPQILKDRFELNINNDIAKEVLLHKDNYTKVLTETFDLNLLVDSITRVIKNVDTLYIHPHFLTTINLPDETEIVYAKSSVEMFVFDFSRNLLMIQPQKDFVNGNILLTYRDSNRVYYMNLILYKYTQKPFDEKLNKYVADDNYLSLNYKYIKNEEINAINILKHYLKLNGDNIVYAFKKDGDYDVIQLGGVSYFIVRDSQFGSVDYKGVRFSVSTKYMPNEKTLKNKKIQRDRNYVPDIIYKGGML